MTVPSLTPTYLLSALTTIVGLFLTQGLIGNGTEKLVTGLAAVLIPAAFAVAQALFHGRVVAAKIAAASASTTGQVAPVIPVKKPGA